MNRWMWVLVAALLAACGGGGAAEAEPHTSTDELLETAGGDRVADVSEPLAMPNQAAHEGRLLTSGQPTEDDLRAAAAAGYSTVISLRTPSEGDFDAERALVEALGMQFVSLPVAGADGVTAENAARLDELLSEATGPTIVHCASSNRVGALFALRAFAAGRSIEQALESGRAAGLGSLEDTVRERLAEMCAAASREDC